MNKKNIYIEALHRNLPRLLSSFNMDTTSPLAGVGDRLHWSWKLIDFPNGTFQAAAHGLAILVYLNKLPHNITQRGMLNRIDYIVKGLKNITSKNGSLDEALPNESSFCVTALVASDILAARNILSNHLSSKQKKEWLNIIKPLINFLMKQDESHGVISNHLASASLAMYRWHKVTGDKKAEERGRIWLNRVLGFQSSEGWFKEYEGADPGYQSWCTTQLVQLHALRPDLKLIKPLSHSISFLVYAAHPDGSFGGSYGSRNTRFLLPGGLEYMAKIDENAAALSKFAQDGIVENKFVTLDSVDAGNLVPFFNDYAFAALSKIKNKKNKKNKPLPFEKNKNKTWFPKAGWLIDSGRNYYNLINLKRGGTCIHFKNSTRRYEDPGIVVQDHYNRQYTSFNSKALNIENFKVRKNNIILKFNLLNVKYPKPSPVNFIILRILSLTLFRSLYFGNLIKRLLAKHLIKHRPQSNMIVTRAYKLGENFFIKNKTNKLDKLKIIKNNRHFSNMHMASQGYWQTSDDEL